jgi:hypothetical protein
MLCTRQVCGDGLTVIHYGYAVGHDQYYLLYSGDRLVQVNVFPWLGDPTQYCLAGPSTPIPLDLLHCSAATVCNTNCIGLTQSACNTQTPCGAGTQMTMCDGTTRTYTQCVCNDFS